MHEWDVEHQEGSVILVCFSLMGNNQYEGAIDLERKLSVEYFTFPGILLIHACFVIKLSLQCL